MISPLSLRLTFRTCSTCFSMLMFLWRIPMPPSLARAIARVASVTVSIAADNMGIFRVMSRVSLLRMSTSRGKTCEKAGNNSTSSNVNPSPKNFEGDFDLLVGGFILAMCKGRAADKYGPNFYEQAGGKHCQRVRNDQVKGHVIRKAYTFSRGVS